MKHTKKQTAAIYKVKDLAYALHRERNALNKDAKTIAKLEKRLRVVRQKALDHKFTYSAFYLIENATTRNAWKRKHDTAIEIYNISDAHLYN